jgi:hypothetical protein
MTEVSKIQSNTVNIMKKSYALILLYVSLEQKKTLHTLDLECSEWEKLNCQIHFFLDTFLLIHDKNTVATSCRCRRAVN